MTVNHRVASSSLAAGAKLGVFMNIVLSMLEIIGCEICSDNNGFAIAYPDETVSDHQISMLSKIFDLQKDNNKVNVIYTNIKVDK